MPQTRRIRFSLTVSTFALLAWLAIAVGMEPATTAPAKVPTSAAITQPAEATAPPPIDFPSGTDKVVVPLILAGEMYLVPGVAINGKDVGYFILDTGASLSLIEPNVADQLGIRDDHRPARARFRHTFQSMTFGGMTIWSPQMVVRDINGMREFFGYKIAGIVGGDVLRRAPFTIDPEHSTVTFYKPDRFVPPSGPPVAITVVPDTDDRTDVNVPLTRVEIDGIDCQAVIDYGYNCECELLPVFTAKHPEMIDFSSGPFTSFVSGVAEGRLYTAKVKSVEIGGRKVNKAPVKTGAGWLGDGDEADPKLGTVECLIGRSTMDHFRVTFDYASGKMWMEPAERPSVAQQLAAKSIDPNGRDPVDWTPLMTAAIGKDTAGVDALLAAGAKADADEFHGRTVLYFAARGGEPAIMRKLLQIPAVAAQVNTGSADGETPLMVAAERSDPEILEQLLKAGADQRRTSRDGDTALHHAVRRGSLGAVQALIKTGADLDAVNSDQDTPLGVAAENGNIAVFDALVQAGAKRTYKEPSVSVLQIAADAGNVDLVRHILDDAPAGKTAVDVPDDLHVTPLIRCCASGRVKTAQFLIDHGADVNAVTVDGASALRLSAQSGKEQVVRLLLAHHADVENCPKGGTTSLVAAAAMDFPTVVDALLNAGARVDVRDPDGQTALIYAARYNRVEIVKRLLDGGADPNLSSNDGTTAGGIANALGFTDLKAIFEADARRRATTKPAK